MKLTEVAAAVIERPDGSFLLGQRAPHTFYPGYWEFPGGKVEPGESPRDALVRELHEELAIEVLRAYPWIVREHRYEHAHVRLYFFRVTEWRGEVRDHVHSALEWQRADALTVAPMLPANAPILAALGLPDFYAITQAHQIGAGPQLVALEAALKNGLRLVQLREAQLPPDQREAFAAAVTAQCHRHGARVLVNRDAQLAWAVGADGLHLSSEQLLAARGRPNLPLVAASCHNAAELHRAIDIGADFAVLGPVATTASHPGREGLGWDAVATLLAKSPLPVYALGGLGRADLHAARSAGAHGVAAIRAAWSAQ